MGHWPSAEDAWFPGPIAGKHSAVRLAIPRHQPGTRVTGLVWALFAALLASGDGITTWVALHTGVGYESNPVAANGLALLGTGLGLTLGLFIRLVVAFGLAVLATQRRYPIVSKFALGVLVATVLWWAVILASNVRVLAAA